MGAQADAECGAQHGQRSPDRVNSRNSYRQRPWDTRADAIDLAIPRLRSGSYFPEWLLNRRSRAESALITVVASAYVLGVSTRRLEKLVATLGITSLSKSQVSEMSRSLDVLADRAVMNLMTARSAYCVRPHSRGYAPWLGWLRAWRHDEYLCLVGNAGLRRTHSTWTECVGCRYPVRR